MTLTRCRDTVGPRRSLTLTSSRGWLEPTTSYEQIMFTDAGPITIKNKQLERSLYRAVKQGYDSGDSEGRWSDSQILQSTRVLGQDTEPQTAPDVCVGRVRLVL